MLDNLGRGGVGGVVRIGVESGAEGGGKEGGEGTVAINNTSVFNSQLLKYDARIRPDNTAHYAS